MATRDELIRAGEAAHAKGDSEAAQFFAEEIKKLDAGQQAPVPPQATPEQQPSSFDLYKHPVSQGATMGWGDELAAALGTYTGIVNEQIPVEGFSDIPGVYSGVLKGIRGEQEQAKNLLGGKYTGAELAGGLIPITRAAQTTSPTALDYGKQGAGFGLVGGAGYADPDPDMPLLDSLRKRAKAGAFGASIGLPFAIGLGKSVEATSRLAGQGIDALKGLFATPEKKAANVMQHQLDAYQVTPDELLGRLDTMPPQARLADTDEALGLLTDAMAQRPGFASREIKEALKARHEGQLARIEESLADLTGVASKDFHGSRNAIIQARKEVSKPAYDAAYAQEIPLTGEMKSLLKRPSLQKAFKEAQKNAAEEGIELPPLYRTTEEGGMELAEGVIPDMRAWDNMKKGLDDAIATALRNDPAEARRLLNTKREMVAILDDINPAYAEARNVFGTAKSLEDAMDFGRNIFKDDSDLTAEAIAQMGKSEKEMYVIGAYRAIMDRLKSKGKTDNVVKERILKSELMRERLRNAFPDNDAFNTFMKTIENEGDMASTYLRLFGSQTAGRKITDDFIQQAERGTENISMGNMKNALLGAFNDPVEREKMAGVISNALMSDATNARQLLPGLLSQARTQPNFLTRGAGTAGKGAAALAGYGSAKSPPLLLK